ncbi:MAG: nucleotidyltransferase domain-containing protein [Balneolales bacterium]
MQSNHIADISLGQQHLDTIKKVAASFPEIEKIILFGSRAIGSHRKGSDIDLALTGQNVTHATVLRLHDILDQETMIPYRIDLSNYNTLQNTELKRHIQIHGVVIFEKRMQSTFDSHVGNR